MKKKSSRAEREHMSKVAELGCIACYTLGYPDTPAEIHHPRQFVGMGQRSSHYDVIPLCPFHHRTGQEAVHVSPAKFQAKFGSEDFLLNLVRVML